MESYKVIFSLNDEVFKREDLVILCDKKPIRLKRNAKTNILYGEAYIEKGEHTIKIFKEDVWKSPLLGTLEMIFSYSALENDIMPYEVKSEFNINVYQEMIVELTLDKDYSIVYDNSNITIGKVIVEKNSFNYWRAIFLFKSAFIFLVSSILLFLILYYRENIKGIAFELVCSGFFIFVMIMIVIVVITFFKSKVYKIMKEIIEKQNTESDNSKR